MRMHAGNKLFRSMAWAPLAIILFSGLWLGSGTIALSAEAGAAEITSPVDGSTLTSTMVAFTWTKAAGSQYWLAIGKSKGAHDIYFEYEGNKLTATIPGLPNDGSTIFVRLWSTRVDNFWDFNDYTYITCKGCSGGYTLAKITAPAPSSTLTGAKVTFSWDAGVQVSEYWLTVGKTKGGREYYNEGQGKKLAATVGRLPNDGSTIFVSLWSLVSDRWLSNDFTFKACTGCAPDGVPAEITSPQPLSTLQSSIVTFKWSAGDGVSLYRLYVGTTVGAQDLYSKTQGFPLFATVTGIPNDGNNIYVRLWSKISESWLYNDYIYKTCKGCVDPAEMISPEPGGVLAGSKITFAWDAGIGVTKYKLSIGKTLGGEEYYSAEGMTLSRMVTHLPTDGSIVYVRLSSLFRATGTMPPPNLDLEGNDTWKFNDYVYVANLGRADIADLASPKPGTKLTDATVIFSWDTGTDVTKYWLQVGKTLGGWDFCDADQGTKLTATVSGLPTDGKPVFVRLWSLVGTIWRFNDYVYLATTTTK